MLWEYVFLLIPDVGYGAASVYLQQMTMICLVLLQGMILPAAQSFCKWVTFGILGALERVDKC